MDHTTFLSEAEYDIRLLCIFTGVGYIPRYAFASVGLKTGQKATASVNATLPLATKSSICSANICLNKIAFVWNRKIIVC